MPLPMYLLGKFRVRAHFISSLQCLPAVQRIPVVYIGLGSEHIFEQFVPRPDFEDWNLVVGANAVFKKQM